MSFSTRKPIGLSLITGVMALGMLILAPIASALVRPAGATPISASLVLAYDECTVATPAGQEHNTANLPGFACAPQTASSTLLTAGNPQLGTGAANFRGNLLTKVCGPPPNALLCPAPLTSDVLFPSGSPSGNFVVDVRCGVGMIAPVCGNANAVGGADYGALAPPPALAKATAVIRITDINTGPAGGPYTTEGTTKDLNFDVPMVCSVTASTTIGGTCLPAVASANAGCGGCVATGKRSNIEVQTLRVQDGGPDAHPFIPDVPNKNYAVQGVFIP
jgi:hypothetical protein